MKSDLSNNAEQFVPTEDVTETTDDGRTIQLAVKGVPMPVADAMALGLVKGAKPSEPSVAGAHNAAIAAKRGAAPAENKAGKPSEKKSEKAE